MLQKFFDYNVTLVLYFVNTFYLYFLRIMSCERCKRNLMLCVNK